MPGTLLSSNPGFGVDPLDWSEFCGTSELCKHLGGISACRWQEECHQIHHVSQNFDPPSVFSNWQRVDPNICDSET